MSQGVEHDVLQTGLPAQCGMGVPDAEKVGQTASSCNASGDLLKSSHQFWTDVEATMIRPA